MRATGSRLWHLSCARPSGTTRGVSVAIVGSGPAGMYTADELLRSSRPPRRIDVFDRSPLPFGLLRYGVAPDHPEVRLVEHKFHNEVLDDGAVRLFGRVAVGDDVSLAQLRASYDAVFLCHGAARSRFLPLPLVAASPGAPPLVPEVPFGTHGLWSSQQVVGWYNADLAHARLTLGLDRVRDVVLIGNGNVAIDIARMLLKEPALLEDTTVSRVALAELRASRVRTVTVVARRGPEHAAFATKELREMAALANVDIRTDAALQPVPEAADRGVKRMLKLLEEATARPSKGPHAKQLRLVFGRSPTSLVADADGKLAGLVAGGQRLDAQLVVSCIGYVASTLDAAMAPLAASGAHMSNEGGRIARGLYATGWCKRGASGIVATNKFDAAETVAAFLRDGIEARAAGEVALPAHALTREQLERLEHQERLSGRFTTWDDMAAALLK